MIYIQMSFIDLKFRIIIAESDQIICFEFQIVWSKKKDDKCNSSLAKQSSNANQWQVGASLRRSSGRRDAGNGSSAFEGKKIWKYGIQRYCEIFGACDVFTLAKESCSIAILSR